MPTHCDRPMHSEKVGNETKLVCWMGPSCSVVDIPKHCDAPMHETAYYLALLRYWFLLPVGIAEIVLLAQRSARLTSTAGIAARR